MSLNTLKKPLVSINNRIRKLVSKPVIFFIHQAWIILFCVLLLLVFTPFVLWWHYNFQPAGYVLESLYVFMGEPPSILHQRQTDYSNLGLSLLLTLRCAGWLIVPLVLAIVLDEGRKMIEDERKKLEDLEKRAVDRIAQGKKLLQEDLDQWKKELEKEGKPPAAIGSLTSDDE